MQNNKSFSNLILATIFPNFLNSFVGISFFFPSHAGMDAFILDTMKYCPFLS